MEFLHTKLACGLEIVGELNPSAVSASVEFLIRAGARDESPEEAGISHFIEHLLFKGDTTRTADDVNRFFDDRGADYNACTAEEATVYYASVPPESLIPVTRLWAELLQPALRPEDIEPERQVILEEIRMYDDMPPFGMDEKARAIFFGDHPLAGSVAGTAETVSAITPEQLRAYHRTHYTADRTLLAVTGKFDFDEVVRTAEELCSELEPSGRERSFRPATTTTGRHDLIRDSAQQSYAIQFADAPDALDDRRFAAKILATLIGDESGSRFFWELSDPGLAESVSMSHCEHLDAGCFITWMSCDPEEMESNLDILREVYESVRSDGFDDAELLRARNKVASQIVLAGERPRGRLFAVGGSWLQQHRYYSIRDELEILRGITMADLESLLRDFPPDRNLTVTIGAGAKH